MSSIEPRLAIDYGTCVTTALVVWPDGRWSPLLFDGATALSSAVFVAGNGELLTGAAAWQHNPGDPRHLVEAPLRAGMGTVTVADAPVEVRDLVAASLRRIEQAAAGVVGAPVTHVRMVVPAGWGPRRRTWFRQAAYAAGLGQPELVEAPVAVADRLLAVGVQVTVGSFLLICDVGAGCEVSVLRRGPAGFEVLSTLADPEAGGLRIDELLAGAVLPTGTGVDGAAARSRVAMSVRTAKEALSQLPAVTVLLPPPAAAVVLDSATAQECARPVYERVAELAVQVIAAADLTPDRLAGVYCVGGASAAPALAAVLGQRLTTAVQSLPDPATVAVLGAAQATADGTGGTPEPIPPEPPVRRAVALAVPGVASLALFAHFLLTASFYNGTRTNQRYGFYVLANWGELAMAALFALIGCLAAGSLFGAGLSRDSIGRTGRSLSAGAQVATGVLAAAATGLSIAGLYGVFSALYLGLHMGSPLRWSVLTCVPVAVIAAVIGLLAVRLRHPRGGWDAFLAFPASAVVAGAAGMLLVQYAMVARPFADTAVWIDLAKRGGGLLLGIGVACVLVDRWVPRLLIAIPLALFSAIIVSARSTGILAAIFAIAVALWWAHRLWQLIRSPLRPSDHGR